MYFDMPLHVKNKHTGNFSRSAQQDHRAPRLCSPEFRKKGNAAFL